MNWICILKNIFCCVCVCKCLSVQATLECSYRGPLPTCSTADRHLGHHLFVGYLQLSTPTHISMTSAVALCDISGCDYDNLHTVVSSGQQDSKPSPFVTEEQKTQSSFCVNIFYFIFYFCQNQTFT